MAHPPEGDPLLVGGLAHYAISFMNNSKTNSQFFFVYFIQSIKTGKIYVGYSSKDPKIRLKEHNLGKNKWTHNHRPFKLVYYEKYLCKQDAIFREKFYKSGFGQKIKDIIVKYLTENH